MAWQRHVRDTKENLLQETCHCECGCMHLPAIPPTPSCLQCIGPCTSDTQWHSLFIYSRAMLLLSLCVTVTRAWALEEGWKHGYNSGDASVCQGSLESAAGAFMKHDSSLKGKDEYSETTFNNTKKVPPLAFVVFMAWWNSVHDYVPADGVQVWWVQVSYPCTSCALQYVNIEVSLLMTFVAVTIHHFWAFALMDLHEFISIRWSIKHSGPGGPAWVLINHYKCVLALEMTLWFFSQWLCMS